MIIDHGVFASYVPADPTIPAAPVRPATPEELPAWDAAFAAWLTDTAAARLVRDIKAAGGLFLRNESNVDWYGIAHAVPAAGRRFAVVAGGRVAAISADPSTLWPIDARLVETDATDVQAGWLWQGGALVDPATLAPTADELAAHAAAKRWSVETGGCLDPADRPIATDRDSQSKLIAEMVAIGAGMRTDPSPWKFADGTLASLTNAEMLAVIGAARAHIAAAFAAEAAVLAAIAANSVTTRAAIDTWPWPAND